LLFKSFTNLTVQEFNDIYDKETVKKYEKRYTAISKRNGGKNGERKARCKGRPFKLDVKNRFLVLLIYYRSYITYALSGFILDLDQSNV
jgi:hypothetical protein